MALDLQFTTTRKQPPNVEQLAKHYVDLLESRDDPHGEGSWGLYDDDKQVKLLFVAARHDWDPEDPIERPLIQVQCRTRADAVTELEAAHELELEGHEIDVDEDARPLYDEAHVELMLDEARYLSASDDQIGQAIAADIRLDVLRMHQEDFLATSDRLLAKLMRSHARELLTGATSAWKREIDRSTQAGADLASDWAEMLSDLQDIAGAFQVALPPLPAKPGERKCFNEGLHAACLRFLARYPSLSPLVVPLRVTILVVPPATKDLDNIAVDVLPVLLEHFRPHREPCLLEGPDVGRPPGLLAGQLSEERNKARARLRSVGEYGIWAYQALELHRRPEHPRDGWMAVMLGQGENRHSLWEAAARDVDRFLERDD